MGCERSWAQIQDETWMGHLFLYPLLCSSWAGKKPGALPGSRALVREAPQLCSSESAAGLAASPVNDQCGGRRGHLTKWTPPNFGPSFSSPPLSLGSEQFLQASLPRPLRYSGHLMMDIDLIFAHGGSIKGQPSSPAAKGCQQRHQLHSYRVVQNPHQE